MAYHYSLVVYWILQSAIIYGKLLIIAPVCSSKQFNYWHASIVSTNRNDTYRHFTLGPYCGQSKILMQNIEWVKTALICDHIWANSNCCSSMEKAHCLCILSWGRRGVLMTPILLSTSVLPFTIYTWFATVERHMILLIVSSSTVWTGQHFQVWGPVFQLLMVNKSNYCLCTQCEFTLLTL